MPGRADIEAGRAFVRLFLKDDLTKKLQQSLSAIGATLKDTGQQITALGKRMAATGLAVSTPFGFALKTFASFDDEMRTVAAVTGAVGAGFDSLTEKAKALGASTSFTATEVALLMAELGRAGFVASDVENMTGAVLNLARATKTEAATSAGIMASAIRQFGLEAGESTRVADALTAAANKSFNTVETLGESLKYAGPVANDFNMSLEDTLAVLGGLGNVGIQGSNAGSAVRRLLTLTGAEAEKMKKIFGVEFVDAAGNARPLIDTLADVTEATKGLGTAARAEKFNEAFGLLGITGASAIGKTAVDIRELAKEIKTSGGLAEETAAAMDAGLGGAFRIFKSAVEGAAIAVGEVLSPVLTPLIEKLTKTIQASIEWIKNNRALVVSLAAIGAALVAGGASLVAFGLTVQVLGVVFSGVAAAIGTVVTAVGALLSPLGLTVAAVVAGAVAWVKYTESGRRAMNAVKRVLGSLLTEAKRVFGGINEALAAGDIALAAEIAFTALKLAAMKALDALSGLVGGTITTIASQILKGDFAGAWSTTLEGLSSLWATWSEGIVSLVTSMAESVVNVWEKMVAFIADKILELASQPGYNTLFKFVFGVDLARIKQEIERGRNLNEQLREKGLGGELRDPLEEAKATATGLIRSHADTARGVLDDARRAARDTAEKASAKLEVTVDKGMSDLFFETLLTEGDLSRLVEKAKAMREKSKDKEKEGEPAPEPEEEGAVTQRTGLSGISDLVTFSADAAIAAGFAASATEDKAAKETRKHREEAHKDALKLIETDEKIIKAVESIGLGLTYG